MTETMTSWPTKRRGAVALGAATAIVGGGMLAVAFATPAAAAEGDEFTYQVYAWDNSDPDNPILNPPGYEWEIVAAGPMTYTSEFPTALVVDDVVGGTYSVSATPNAEAAAGSWFDSIQCFRWPSDIPFDELEDSDYELFTPTISGGAFQVPVLDGYYTSCIEFWTIGDDAPDGSVIGDFTLRSSQNLVGHYSDVDLVLHDASGASLGSFNQTELIVPPGTYTPLVVASEGAQPGFDVDAWEKSSWSCSSVQTGPFEVAYGASFTVPAGTAVHCYIQVAEHFGNVFLGPYGGSWEGDVTFPFQGSRVIGDVGAEFTFGYEVQLPETPGVTPDPNSVEVTVSLPNNTAPGDPFQVAPGWTLVSSDPDTGEYTYIADGPMSGGETREISFSAVIANDDEGTSGIEVCATAFYDGYQHTVCDGVGPVGDGECPDGQWDGEQCAPTPPPTTEPPATTPATTTPAVTPTATAPAGTEVPTTPAPTATTPDDALVVTDGGGTAPGIALGIVALAAGLGLLATLRRRSAAPRGTSAR